MRTVLLLFALTLAAGACATRPPETRRPDAAPARPGAPASVPAPPAAAAGPAGRAGCAADGDCVVVKADCCGCTAGGTAATVPRGQQAAYEAAQAQRCGAIACITMMSNDPSCSARPRCVAGSCRLGP